VDPERQSKYAVAFCLLLAGAIPQLTWTADDGFKADFVHPTPLAEAFGPELTQSAVFFPAVAGLLALILAASMPRWLRSLGFVALGAGLLAFAADRSGVAAAFNGQFDGFMRGDFLLLGGIALAFVATRAQADDSPGLLLSLFAAVGGLAVLAWLVMPRGTSPGDVWLGLVSRDHADTIPIARGVLRNGEFSEGTHFMRYVWWNLTLGALVLFPLLCLRIPTRWREYRPQAADLACGALVFVLLSLPLSAALVAALGDNLKLRSVDGEPIAWQSALVAATNTVRLMFPPLLLAGLALIGMSDFLKSLSTVRLPRLRHLRLPRLSLRRRTAVQSAPPPIRPVFSVPRQPGRAWTRGSA
jgi:hypothetical protein